MINLDRRQLIVSAAFGLGGLMLPGGRAFAQAMIAARGFTHGIASGEPSADSMLLWTRFVGDGDSAHVRAEIATTPDFARPVGGAQVITGPWRDWTVKATVDGLEPGRTYFYRFIGPDGSVSPMGRTKTLAMDGARAVRIAVFSCANIGFGYFNAYAHAAARDDIDLCFHLGDYFYEAKLGEYPALPAAVRTAQIQPVTELIHLADYRMRHAAYRTDPDLLALHARHPMIASTDDHDTVNDSWEGGAGAHQPDEGDYSTRKAAAMQAWHEWLPVEEVPWKAYRIGRLASIFRTDTRTIARSQQAPFAKAVTATDPDVALKDFASTTWLDPARTIFGTAQEHWLNTGVTASVRDGVRWQVVGSGTLMGTAILPQSAENWLAPTAREVWRQRFARSFIAAKYGLPSNYDSWAGYPAARTRFLKGMQRAGANAVVISGDSHNGWAFDLPQDGHPAAVEFGGQAVTSPGIDEATGPGNARAITSDYVAANPGLKWMDPWQRGYMALTLTPESATNEWVFMDTVASRSLVTRPSHRLRTRPDG